MKTKISAPQQSLLQTMFSLSGSCPFDEGNPCTCPLHEIRKMDLENRLEWARGLSDEETYDLFTHHQACLEEKQCGRSAN